MTPQQSALDYPPELVTYERHRDQLKWEDIGKFALVQGEELAGIYGTAAEACAEANRRFGRARFLLKQIGAPEDYLYLGEGPVLADGLVPNGRRAWEGQDHNVYFARELATYERYRGELERQHMGRVALLYGSKLVGVFDTLEEASEAGVRRFGLERFLFKEIGDPVHFCPLGVLPGTPEYRD